MFKVISRFADLQDNNHVYEAGDVFPREGMEWRFSLMQGRGHAIEIDRQVFRNS